ncbi:MAG: T9SS type A sorting domain-containing protein, partial [candidate division KSB1 bacterium]|nr:T9SS type A sorting domain-containing protein [candidate division KSB1 bacterium]
ALPVELIEFIASVEQAEAGPRVRLTWKTASESNNFGFEVQRSRDRVSFQTIVFIPGAGTTLRHQNYEFVDSDLAAGVYYYRLKQIDTDGAIQFTEPQCVEVAAPRSYALRQNYPNPFNPSTEIVYQLKEQGKVKLVVYNVLGEVVATLVDQVQEAGVHRVTFDASNLPTGLFFYRLRVNDFDQVRKMAVLK